MEEEVVVEVEVEEGARRMRMELSAVWVEWVSGPKERRIRRGVVGFAFACMRGLYLTILVASLSVLSMMCGVSCSLSKATRASTVSSSSRMLLGLTLTTSTVGFTDRTHTRNSEYPPVDPVDPAVGSTNTARSHTPGRQRLLIHPLRVSSPNEQYASRSKILRKKRREYTGKTENNEG